MNKIEDIMHSSHVEVSHENGNIVKIFIKHPEKNMQSDATCFEALALIYKCALSKKIEKVEIGFNHYNSDTIGKGAKKYSYNRFLYRLDLFQRAFPDWVMLTEKAGAERDAFVSMLVSQSPSNNIPERKAEFKESKGIEHVIENKLARTKNGQEYLSQLYQDETKDKNNILPFSIYNQLPCGLFNCGISEKPKEEKRIFPTGFFDIWGLDDKKNFCIFELKKDEKNEHLGVISQLFFYAAYSQDILLNKDRLHQKNSRKNYRGYNELYDAIINSEVLSVKAVFLFGQGVHPHIEEHKEELIKLMNANSLGIGFDLIKYDYKLVSGFPPPDYE
jgi:hypothetical protein